MYAMTLSKPAAGIKNLHTSYVSFLLLRGGALADDAAPTPADLTSQPAAPQPTVIPGADSLIADLLDMDLGPPMAMHQQQMYTPTTQQPVQSAGGMDLLGEGLDSLVS